MLKSIARLILGDELKKCKDAAAIIENLQYQLSVRKTTAEQALENCTQACAKAGNENSKLLAQLKLKEEEVK